MERVNAVTLGRCTYSLTRLSSAIHEIVREILPRGTSLVREDPQCLDYRTATIASASDLVVDVSRAKNVVIFDVISVHQRPILLVFFLMHSLFVTSHSVSNGPSNAGTLKSLVSGRRKLR